MVNNTEKLNKEELELYKEELLKKIGEKKLKGIEKLIEEYEKLEEGRPKLGEKQNGYIDATQEKNQDKNSFDNYLKNITIDYSINNVGKLIQKYKDEAKKVDWKNVFFSKQETDDIYFGASIGFSGLTSGGNDENGFCLFIGDGKIPSNEIFENIFKEKNVLDGTNIYCIRPKGQAIKEESKTNGTNKCTGQTEESKFDIDPLGQTNEALKKACENVVNRVLGGEELGYKLHFVLFAIDIAPNDTQKRLTYFYGVSKEETKFVRQYGPKYVIKPEIEERIRDISSQIRNRHISNLMELVRRESVKSAKAAIMSRNMSHNLGSHVMFYIKQNLESADKILTSEVLQELININACQTPDWDRLIGKIKNLYEFKLRKGDFPNMKKEILEMPFLVGLGRFINYLQERQDFIATVATNYIPYRTSINFKDAIYDELKPEKHAQRHVGDATGKKAANLLLDYIAYSEGFRSCDKIELYFGDEFHGGKKPSDVPPELRTFRVALPGGNLGRQAIFSIMENIIRNTAKHDGSKAIDGKLVFQFDILDAKDIKEKEICGHSLRDGETKTKNITDEINDFDIGCYQRSKSDYTYLGITVRSCFVSEETKQRLLEGLQRGYITPDGLMDEDCKGLKEIRISSAWLRGHELDDEIPQNEPPAVAIRKTDLGYLQYIICIPKPKKVACIVSNNCEDGLIKKLEGTGLNSFKENKIHDATLRKIANYEFVVVDNAIEKWDLMLRNNVGARVFKMDINQIDSLDQIYETWLKKSFKIKEDAWPTISILDGDFVQKNDSDEKRDEKVRESGTSELKDEYFNNALVYCRHYSGQPNSNEAKRKQYAKAYFVEAVSGGNSTYRLVRQDDRNIEWYVKQVAAGMTKVAIFDERLYSVIMPAAGYEPKDIEKVVCDFFKDKSIVIQPQDDIWKVFHKEILIDSLKINRDVAYVIYNGIKEQKEPLDWKGVINILSKYIHIKDYSKTWQYREAGIWAFNIKIESESGKVKIMGYNAPVEKIIGEYSDCYREKEIAVIENKDGEIKIETLNKLNVIENEDKIKHYRFDFITVHQGILDKIYSTLKVDKSKKEKVTSELFNYFSVLNESGYDQSLPQFIIHSGRSKPNAKDMPQKQPFLQFSALDHALRDCKYTLVELLNSAHYE